MRITKSGLFVLIISLAVACSGMRGPTQPDEPDNGGSPGNPGGGNVVTEIRYGIYEGDCPKSPSDCSGETLPTGDPAQQEPGNEATYLVKNRSQVYTLWTFVDHPGILGRRIKVTTNVNISWGNMDFDEGEAVWASPAGMGMTFSLTHSPGKSVKSVPGSLFIVERGTDTLVKTHRVINIFFRAPA